MKKWKYSQGWIVEEKKAEYKVIAEVAYNHVKLYVWTTQQQ